MKSLGKLLRYGAVSAIATTTSLTVLGVLVSTRAVSPALANVIATGVGTVPSFELNRRWVWHKTGTRTQYVLLDRVLFGHDQDMAMADPARELPT